MNRVRLQVNNITFSEHHVAAPANSPRAQSPPRRRQQSASRGGEPDPARSPFLENGDVVEDPQTSSSPATDSGGVRRVCVLEANIINRTDLALQVRGFRV